MNYAATNISNPPLNPWAPDDEHINHVSKPDESRWRHAKAAPMAPPQADAILRTLNFEEEYYRQQRKLGYGVGILLNGISEFFRGFSECLDRSEAGSSR